VSDTRDPCGNAKRLDEQRWALAVPTDSRLKVCDSRFEMRRQVLTGPVPGERSDSNSLS